MKPLIHKGYEVWEAQQWNVDQCYDAFGSIVNIDGGNCCGHVNKYITFPPAVDGDVCSSVSLTRYIFHDHTGIAKGNQITKWCFTLILYVVSDLYVCYYMACFVYFCLALFLLLCMFAFLYVGVFVVFFLFLFVCYRWCIYY